MEKLPESPGESQTESASSWSNFEVSLVANAHENKTTSIRVGEALDHIRNGKYRAEIQRIRAVTGDQRKKLKESLPAVMWSGTFKLRANAGITAHSGLLCADLDNVAPDSIATTRAALVGSPCAAAVFVSPSGCGLKAVFRVCADTTAHKASFQAVREHVRKLTGLEIDRACCDVARLCFVSHDPDLWTNRDAKILPIPAGEAAPEQPPQEDGELNFIILPSGTVSISDSARQIFRRIAPSETIFWRGGALAEIARQDGIDALEVIKPDAFRSRVERFGTLLAWRSGAIGEPVLKPAKISRDDAAAIMATLEARELLPPVVSVLRCPVLTETDEGEVVVLGRGYHRELDGLLIVAGDTPQQVPLQEAVASLCWVVEQFDFQSEGDRSRALAAFLTPALRLGGFLRGNIPMDVAEADQSQAGKGYRHDLVRAAYNECCYLVTARKGGVGSTDESFGAALIAGRPFVCLDNFRGKLDSQHLEAFLTCPGLFPVRIPYLGEILLDPKRFILQMTSNGVEATRDLANRASMSRIRKRSGFAYRDTLGELQRRQPYFLGCIFSILAAWIANGKPKTADCRHDFRDWNQTLDWIVQNLIGCAPLMDGHEAAQERVSNPALSWLRAVALAVSGENQLGKSLTASELVELCELHGLVMPGNPKNADEAKKQAGRLFSRLFTIGEKLDVDGFIVTRSVQRQSRGDAGGAIETKNYTFAKT